MQDDTRDSDARSAADLPTAPETPPEPPRPEVSPTPVEIRAAVAEDLGMDPSLLEGEDMAIASDEPEKLLGFYDRLRTRIMSTVEKRGGKLGADVVRVLLLVPDIFLLLVRLALDKEVPGSTRALIASVLAYFVLPLDFLPEAVLGGAGFLDDIVLATALLSHTFGGELEPYTEKHWSGPEDLRVVVRDITESANRLIGNKTHNKLTKLFDKVGKGKPSAESTDP